MHFRFVLLFLAANFSLTSPHRSCVLLPNDPVALGQFTPLSADGQRPDLKLWGLTLGMTLDLLSSMSLPPLQTTEKDLSTYPHAVTSLDLPLPAAGRAVAPSMASIFPRFCASSSPRRTGVH